MAGGPLRWFRKYQKLMLGVFGVLLMIVFTLSFGSGVDPIIEYLSGGAYASSTEDPVVVTWKGGKLHSSQINNLRQRRAMLNQLMITAQYEAMQRNGRSQTHGLDQSVSDENLMQLVLLSREAERLGINITDDAILNFLIQTSGGTMQPAEFLDLWQRITGSTERQLLSILRTELAAQKVRAMALAGYWSTSPIQFWDYFNQLERFVSAELMPIAVDEFVDKVPEPSEAELNTFYEKFKDRYPMVGSPEPGFKRRMRRAFDYVKVDYNLFLQSEMEKITDEQVAEYYEANKDEFLETLPASDLELEDDSLDADNSEEGDKNEQPNEVDINADTESGSETAPDAESGTELPAAEDEEAAGETAQQAVEEEAADPEGSASFTPVPQEPDAALAGEQATEETASSVTESTEVAQETEPDAESGDASEMDSQETSADSANDEGAAADKSSSETDAEPSNEEQQSETKEKKYRSLEDVTDSIKERLAAESAQKNFKNAISQIQSKMDRYYRKYVFWEIKKDKEDSPPPEMPDLADVDSPVPLNIQSMPLSDRFESAAYELGQQYDLEFNSQSIEQVPFSQSAYVDNLPVYQPSVFPTGQVMTKFVFWVTSQEDAYSPKLEDIHDEVVRAWKLGKARELALADGAKAAETARAEGTTLAEACAKPGRNFLDTGEITWMTGGSVGLQAGGLPQPASIPGVEFPGPKLLKTMFRLREGEVGVALDAPQTTAYVIRVSKVSPSLDQRQERFLSDGIRMRAVSFLAGVDNRNVLTDWTQELMDSYDVTWAQDPSSREQ